MRAGAALAQDQAQAVDDKTVSPGEKADNEDNDGEERNAKKKGNLEREYLQLKERRRPQREKCFKMKSLLMSHSSGMKTATDSTLCPRLMVLRLLDLTSQPGSIKIIIFTEKQTKRTTKK